MINEIRFTTIIKVYRGEIQEIHIIRTQLEGRVMNVTLTCKTCEMAQPKCANRNQRKLSKKHRVHKVVLVSQFSHVATNQATLVLNKELNPNKRTAKKLLTTSSLKFMNDKYKK